MARKTIKTLTTTALLALGALAGGCGGDDSPSEHAGEAEPQKAQKSDAAKPNAADDRLAKASLLALRDFPTGWAAEDDDETSSKSSKSNCPAVRELRARRTGKATAPTFAMGNDVTKVFHSVAVFEGPQEAASAYAGIATAETRRCLGKEIAKVFADSIERDGGKVGGVKTSAVRVPSVGDQVDASALQVDLTSEGSTVTAYVETVYVLQGRVVSAVGTTDLLTPFDADLLADLLGKMERRTGRIQAE